MADARSDGWSTDARPTSDGPAGPQHGGASQTPIVTRAGWSPRSKLLATFVAIDVIVLAVVLAILLR